MAEVWSCDFGGGVFHVVQGGDARSCRQVTVQDFVRLRFAEPGDIVLVENAHVQARGDGIASSISLAQGLTYRDQLVLEEAIEAKGVIFRLVPHSLTPKLRTEFCPDLEKADAVDAAVIAKHLDIYGYEQLQVFVPKRAGEWSAAQLFAFEAKREMDLLLNYYRAFSSPTKLKEVKCFEQMMVCGKHAFDTRWSRTLFADAAIHEEVLLSERWIFSTSQTRKKASLDLINNSVLASLWVALFDVDGNPRLLPSTGKPVGINFAWKQLLFNKPNHFRGGIARSNLWHWGFRYRVLPMRYKKDKLYVGLTRDNPDRQELLQLRRQYTAVCRGVMKSLRTAHEELHS